MRARGVRLSAMATSWAEWAKIGDARGVGVRAHRRSSEWRGEEHRPEGRTPSRPPKTVRGQREGERELRT